MLERLRREFAAYGIRVVEREKKLLDGERVTELIFRGKHIGISLDKKAVEKMEEDELPVFISHVVEILDMVRKKLPVNSSDDKDLLRTGTIIPIVVNTEANKMMLEKVPHRDVLDLSLIYCLLLGDENEEFKIVQISNDACDILGITEEELFLRAKKYAEENMSIMSMNDCMCDLLDIDVEMDFTPDPEDLITVIGNKGKKWGACYLAFMALEDEFALKPGFTSPVYILPSTVHELLIVHHDVASVAELASMVMEFNSTNVSPEDRLSNSVYRFDPETNKVELVHRGAPLTDC